MKRYRVEIVGTVYVESESLEEAEAFVIGNPELILTDDDLEVEAFEEVLTMKTLEDYWDAIGLPCEFCKVWECIHLRGCCGYPTRNQMYLLAEEALLRGEY